MKGSFKKYLKELSDEDLVLNIQRQHGDFLRMYLWECPHCGSDYSYDDVCDGKKNFEDTLKCKKCSFKGLVKNLEKKDYRFYREGFTDQSGFFISPFFEAFFNKYKSKIDYDCRLYPEWEKEDIINEMYYSCFKLVLNYGKNKNTSDISKFNTYMWTGISHRHTDFKRKKELISKNPAVICKVCGCQTGQINSSHLMRTDSPSGKGLKGFIGHEKFHESIINKYDLDRNLPLKDLKKLISEKTLSEYQGVFPDSPLDNRMMSIESSFSGETEDDSFNLLDVLEAPLSGVIYDKNLVVYDRYLFPDTDGEYFLDNFPYLYELAIADKKFHRVGKSYFNQEEVNVIHKMLSDLSEFVINDFCGQPDSQRKHKFINELGTIDLEMQKIVSEALELSLINDYPIDAVCSVIGHGNVSEEEVKQWIKIIKDNKKCQELMKKYEIEITTG